MFTIRRSSDLDAVQVWERAANLRALSDPIPLTRTIAEGEPGPGWTFVGRTSLGPFRFDDSMVVERWDPPRQWRIRKIGRVLRGWAQAEVVPTETGCELTWTEELYLGSGGPIAAITRRIGDILGPMIFAPVATTLAAAPETE